MRRRAAPLLNRATAGLYHAGLDLQGRHRLGGARQRPLHAELAVLRPRLLQGVRQAGLATRATPTRAAGGVRQRHALPGPPALDQLGLLQHRQDARRRHSPRATRSASASTRCRRSRRRRTSGRRAGSTTDGRLFCPSDRDAGRPGPARVRPGAPAGDAAADGDGRGDGRERRRRDAAVPRRPHRRARRKDDRPDEARTRSARAISPQTAAELNHDDAGRRPGRHRHARADPGRHGRRQDGHGGDGPRATSTPPGSSASRRPSNPQVAVAVVVEDQPSGFGGAIAAPIAKQVMEASSVGGEPYL